VAALLGAPVVLVVDARGQSHSAAALLHGFSTFDSKIRVAGVILNRVGSPRHEEVLRQACEHAGLTVFGAIPRVDELSLPSRYLGLVTAAEHGAQARAAVEVMIDRIARHVDLAAITEIATSRVTDEPWDPGAGGPVAEHVTVALATGKAFSFGYAEHRELLLGTGAEVAEFDPLTEPLPPRTAALVLPGGFPEQFSTELSGNTVVRQQIKNLAASGAPVHAECAGLAYLVDDLDGHPMCGVLSGSAHFTDRLTLGYRNAVAVTESPLYEIGDRTVGHEFHRTSVEFAKDYPAAWVFGDRPANRTEDGAIDVGVHASYLHVHPAAHPQAISRFVAAADSSFYSIHRNL
jgi:cobyrinic acid a,c-diamide synthase